MGSERISGVDSGGRVVYSVGEAGRSKPRCALCGQPYARHSGGTPNVCPIIPTYRPESPKP
jgi:hypothetical protein